jgi:predicted dehydrogenase
MSLHTNHYINVADLLKSPHKPDAAIVCTPNHTHVSLSKELAAAGVHILVEKPISTDIPSGLDLVEFAENCGVKLLVGHHRRFNPYIVATKSVLEANSLGSVIAVSGLWTTYKPPSYFEPPTEWRQSATAGPVLINLVHDIDVMHHLLGPITRVHAEAIQKRRGFEADEGCAVLLRFASGVVGTFVLSDNAPSPYNFESGTGENPTMPKTGSGLLPNIRIQSESECARHDKVVF